MKILFSAAEASSDAHGAELLKALKKRLALAKPDETLQAFGVGGPKLRDAGLETWVNAGELLAMGTSEVLGRLPRILRALRNVAEKAVSEKPDVAVVIDYPDFHFRLARRLKASGVPVIYYIPPKIWVWRKRRAKVLAERFSKILCIFPFEKEFFRKLGVDVSYVGNPLLDELPLELTPATARAALGLGEKDRVLVILPGSRPSELRNHLHLMLDAASQAARRMREQAMLSPEQPLEVLVPLPATADGAMIGGQIGEWKGAGGNLVRIHLSQGNSAEAMIAADAGLIKSGTSTLEAALLRCPHAVVYRPSALTAWVFENLVRYRGPVGLVNLVAGRRGRDQYVAREILCADVTVDNLAEEAFSLLTDQARRARMRSEFDGIRASLMGGDGSGLGPSERAAEEILRFVESRGRQ